MLRALSVSLTLLAGTALANPDPALLVQDHVLPGFAKLSEKSHALADVAQQDCAPDSAALRTAWGDAFDAWIRVSHLRFGPTEENDRAFALAFWPDTRGFTPRTLQGLIADQDPAVEDAAAFSHVSIAGRGFYALEFLLYDPAFAEGGDYQCKLVQAIATDTARIADEIETEWDGFATQFTDAGTRYATREEALQELFKAVLAGLQFTSDTRIGRPMGTFDKPRATRAEARRSERSLRHVTLSLEGTEELALALAADAPEVSSEIKAAYEKAFAEVASQDSPVFAGVDDPMGRFKVEILQQAVDSLRTTIGAELGPELGVTEGFNALDGD